MKSIFLSTCLLFLISICSYAQTLTPTQTFRGHNKDVKTLIISPDGKTLASGSLDKTALLWDVQTGQIKQRFIEHQGWLWALALSPDGKTLVSACYDTCDVLVWDAQSGQRLHKISPVFSSLTFSEKGDLLIGAKGESLYLLNTQTWKQEKKIPAHTERIYVLTLSSDGTLLATGDMGGAIILWDTQNWQPIRKFKQSGDWIKALAFSPDGKKLVVGSAIMDRDGSQIGGAVNLWDITNQKFQPLMKSREVVWSVSFSPNGRLIAGAGLGGKINLWDSLSGMLKDSFAAHEKIVQTLVFSPDGSFLASGGGDSTIKLWDIKSRY